MLRLASISTFSVLLSLTACSVDIEPARAPIGETTHTAEPQIEVAEQTEAAQIPLSETFNCLRQNGGVAIAAHRGGPYRFYPENAIETLQYGYDNGVRVFEVDVAESQDGVLFLMHDRTLTRTTTQRGAVAETDWADIRSADLVDNFGNVTDFRVPTLAETLDWAVATNAILELDRKPTTSFRNIIAEVREAGAENNVIMISYNDQQAGEIAALAPELMMTATAYGARDIDALLELGVQQEQLIAWTGTSDPDFAAWRRVLAEGVEAAFGTLGRPGERLDDTYLEDGDGSEFQVLADQGLTLLATDTPLEVAEAIDGDEIASEYCGL